MSTPSPTTTAFFWFFSLLNHRQPPSPSSVLLNMDLALMVQNDITAP
ncbi:hypothetical protein BVRB_6g144040 [Beta vulgaris subsp. vulgaris]|uniref:Uncharacterized protein n=1 Tax=Beta vulgaris subsp. vulgaris TaxID=3555 RepID=A0A0J8C749_BETVV|nr:hypothetical protein BVRB_6g144040 [Beta vulgaris subsp. vulgaris]